MSAAVIDMGMFGDVLEKLFAGRWIAGPGMDDAIGIGKRFNRRHISVIFNYLGEALTEKTDVSDAAGTYTKLLDRIAASGVLAAISVKPTQIGMSINYRTALNNYRRIVREARRNNTFVWLDMEEYGHVVPTIRMYSTEAAGGNVGICIQADLRRSAADAGRLARNGGIIRLVKGAYTTPAKYAYTSRTATTENYVRIMRNLFEEADEFMIATHDESVINEALMLNRSHRKRVSYAFLNGIQNGYAARLAESGHRVWMYVPFGDRWISYAYRRLLESGHASLIAKSILKSQRV